MRSARVRRDGHEKEIGFRLEGFYLNEITGVL